MPGARDDPLGDLLLEHQGQRSPPRRPGLGLEPAQEQRGPDIVGQVGDDMRATADARRLVDFSASPSTTRSRSPNSSRARPGPGCSAGRARPRRPRLRLEQGAGQAAGAGADLINPLAVQRAGNRGDPREQLPVEDEILAERLARAEPVPGDDVAQRLGARGSRGVGARAIAHSAAMRIAAAIGRGSARSWPAMSNAVP